MDGAPTPVETRPVYVDAGTGIADVAIYRGAELATGHVIQGPLIVEETTTTVFAGRGDRLEVDGGGNYLIHLAAGEGDDGS